MKVTVVTQDRYGKTSGMMISSKAVLAFNDPKEARKFARSLNMSEPYGGGDNHYRTFTVELK